VSGKSNRAKGRCRTFLACALLLALAVTKPVSAAAVAPSEPSGELLTTVLPNFVAEPLGPRNGPLTPSTVSQFAGQAPGVTDFVQQLENGNLSAYVRVWSHTPPNGDAIEILALHFSNPAEIPSLMAGFANSASRQLDASQFRVPGITGANGYEAPLTTASGAPVRVYIVTFSNADAAFLTYVITESGDMTSADAVKVASAQAAYVGGATVPPSSTGSSPAYVTGELFGGLLVVVGIPVLIVLIVRRTRRNDEIHHGHLRKQPTAIPSSAGWPAPAWSSGPLLPSRTPQHPRWEPIGSNWNEQAYWDGQAWTARRTWSHGRWGPEIPVVYSEDRT
jgi:hypothetical protein